MQQRRQYRAPPKVRKKHKEEANWLELFLRHHKLIGMVLVSLLGMVNTPAAIALAAKVAVGFEFVGRAHKAHGYVMKAHRFRHVLLWGCIIIVVAPFALAMLALLAVLVFTVVSALVHSR